MHIPDGYLSPSTCAVLYAAAAPFWSVAMRRVRQLFAARYVPLVALSAAFSFVISMFNLPLPGGTTGHAVGVAIAAIVVGPWGAMLAISIALAIQALFFGDGGLLALGANCLNIAIAGSLVASVVYRVVSHRATASSSRRVIAAAIAGYAAVNVSALLTAIELGIQPLLFADPSGAPLYAPYPLHVAVPAMMLGHLTLAGFAEALLSGGIVAYLQRAKPSLLGEARTAQAPRVPIWRSLRPLWVGLAILMLLSPLGLIATGTAWGEWSAEDFADPAARAEIAAASGSKQPPAVAPQGLARWSALWSAPVPDYAPRFLQSERAGYVVSAIFGVGLILGVFLAIDAFTARRKRQSPVALT
jgi:cobalt/nickel transport system permease protein